MDILEARDTIKSRSDLARFVYLLREDLISSPDKWENATLERFLEALGGMDL